VKLKGQTALISGASHGLGKSIAETFLKEGASIAICARNEKDLRETQNLLSQFVGKDQKLIAEAVDVSQTKAIDHFVRRVMKQLGRIDILVPNAGVYGPKGFFEENDWEEWVQTLNINLMGTVYLCKSVLPQMKENGFGRIITIGGGGGTTPFPKFTAYGTSKAAILRFSESLAHEVKEFGITVNTIAPGAMNTRLLNEVLKAGAEKVGVEYFAKSQKQEASGGASPENAAELCAFLASKQAEHITGKVISAVWDPWRTLNEHLDDLNTSDIYTLRRILPKERGCEWGDL